MMTFNVFSEQIKFFISIPKLPPKLSNHHGGCGVDMMFPCVLEFLDDAFTITARLINAVSFGPIY